MGICHAYLQEVLVYRILGGKITQNYICEAFSPINLWLDIIQ